MNSQIKAIHTQLRDKNTSRDDFIFLTTRLTRLLIEHAMNFLPFTKTTVKTPMDRPYVGTQRETPVCFLLFRHPWISSKGLNNENTALWSEYNESWRKYGNCSA